MYKNILIPTLMDDEDQLAISLEAAKLLLSQGGKITLLNVVEEVPIYVETYIPSQTLVDNVEEVSGSLKNIAAKLDSNLQTRVVKGHAGRTILSETKELEYDLVVISSHRPGLADYFLGSTAGHVVRHASCPVLVLR